MSQLRKVIIIAAALALAGCGSGEPNKPSVSSEQNGRYDLTVEFTNYINDEGVLSSNLSNDEKRMYTAIASQCEEKESGWFESEKKIFRCKDRETLAMVHKLFEGTEGIHDKN